MRQSWYEIMRGKAKDWTGQDAAHVERGEERKHQHQRAQDHPAAIQKGTRVLISLRDLLMFGRVPKNAAPFLGTRPNISKSRSEVSTRVPFCIAAPQRSTPLFRFRLARPACRRAARALNPTPVTLAAMRREDCRAARGVGPRREGRERARRLSAGSWPRLKDTRSEGFCGVLL